MELLLEPFGGLAGDMLLAGLLHLGDDRFTVADLEALAEALVPGEAVLRTEIVWRGSLSGAHLSVRTPETEAPPHRHLSDLRSLIAASPMSPFAAGFTERVLRRIAEAEGRVHGCSPDEIHFHEVGAVDTLIDVGGCALAIERLGVERVFASPPLLGSGTVRCAHGEMPVPAPATAELLRGLPTLVGGGGGERCTPTGAALLAELAVLGRKDGEDGFHLPGSWRSSAVGYGAGTRDPREGPPNLLRVQLGSSVRAAASIAEGIPEGIGGGSPGRAASLEANGSVLLVEANLDDMTPEAVGYLIERLRSAGALEVWTTAVQMKKDRPGVVVASLVRPAGLDRVAGAYFEHSSTFGVRWHRCDRLEAGRRAETVEVGGLPVRVKLRERPGYSERSAASPLDAAVEHDDAARLAREQGISLAEARERALAALPSGSIARFGGASGGQPTG